MTLPLPADTATLIEDFAVFDDWEDRYSYLVDLGERLPRLPDAEKTEQNKVRGCMSQVWFVRRVPDRPGGFAWQGDSDAAIVRGLIAVLRVVYGGVDAAAAGDVDVEGVFAELGLERHLSTNRRNGFYAMVGKLREFARSASEQAG